MNELLNTFLTIMKEMEASEIQAIENPEVFTVHYEVTIDAIKQLSRNYASVLHNSQISFEVNCEGKNLGFENFNRVSDFLNVDENAQLTLAINKKQRFQLDENTFVFFKREFFFKSFDVLNTNFIKNINFRKSIHFYIPIEKEYSNSYVKLFPIENNKINYAADLDVDSVSELERLIKIREDTSRVTRSFFIPNFYEFLNISDDFKEWFDRNLFLASLIYLSNKFSDTKVIIRGHKNSEIDFSTEFCVKHAKIFYKKIFQFAYEEKHYNDKIEIARNILTIYLGTSDSTEKLDELIPKIEKTISSHFTAYIQDSIKKFFTDRKDVVKETHKYATDLKGESDKLLAYINTSLIGVVTAVFSGALGLSKGDRLFLIVAFTLHAAVFTISYFYNKNYVQERIEEIERVYGEYTKEFVVVAEKDLTDIKDIYIYPAVKNVEKYIIRYRNLIAVLVLLMIGAAATSCFLPDSLLNNKPEENKVKTTISKTGENDPNTQSVIDSIYK
ncbi:hypothetical protein P5G65_25225 [Paenibacillus chondroitinus]|uniref:Uncharacterized protein n=1 Tax=Paenibacillus chondroitinus TaxID=59842 RepID=A0ABU6DIR5_9BACL|nr:MULTISPECIES: hypothetical protein [Paenibacillus]MCY9658500.1 hypothetical protein [Paenibacillus anseongense]MEB4797212.1 hypothetical protein [Paenibacillus chondroitinus]